MQYVVNYAFQVLGAASLPEEERYGFAKMTITTDLPVSMDDADKLMEIGRTIGLEKGYEAVGIQNIEPLKNAFESGDIVLDNDIIEGEIVDDSK